jgi:hypothetical protein
MPGGLKRPFIDHEVTMEEIETACLATPKARIF